MSYYHHVSCQLIILLPPTSWYFSSCHNCLWVLNFYHMKRIYNISGILQTLITIKFVDIIEKIQWTLGIHLWTMLQHFIQKIISAIVFFVQIIHEIPCPFSSAKMILTIDFTILYKRATQANINRKSLTHAYFHKTMANIRSNIQLIKFKVMSLQWSSNICQISGKIMDLSDVCGGSLGAVLEWN